MSKLLTGIVGNKIDSQNVTNNDWKLNFDKVGKDPRGNQLSPQNPGPEVDEAHFHVNGAVNSHNNIFGGSRLRVGKVLLLWLSATEMCLGRIGLKTKTEERSPDIKNNTG